VGKQQLKDQKGPDQKKWSGRQRNPPKEILPRVKKDHFRNVWLDKKIKRKYIYIQIKK